MSPAVAAAERSLDRIPLIHRGFWTYHQHLFFIGDDDNGLSLADILIQSPCRVDSILVEHKAARIDRIAGQGVQRATQGERDDLVRIGRGGDVAVAVLDAPRGRPHARRPLRRPPSPLRRKSETTIAA